MKFLYILPFIIGLLVAGCTTQKSETAQQQPKVLRPADTTLRFREQFAKLNMKVIIVALDKGHTIYKNARNEMFYVDPASGTLIAVTMEEYITFSETIQRNRNGIIVGYQSGFSFPEQVIIMGVDSAGNTVQKNKRGEMFYIDPKTGEQVFI